MFEPLQRLFRGDETKVRHALSIFERVTREDLQRMIRAYEDDDRIVLGQIAHKMKSSCMQIGQFEASDSILVLEDVLSGASESGTLEHAFAVVRHELDCVLTRVADYQTRSGDRHERS